MEPMCWPTCDSMTWIDGVTYTTNNNTATYLFTSSYGCDSVVALDLEFKLLYIFIFINLFM